MAKLNEAELAAAIDSLPGWAVVNGKLHQEYVFPNFVHAFGFMATAAVAIAALDHHPAWLNDQNRVVVDLITHDAGGITAKDVLLAEKMADLAQRLQ